jgi:hypothetical protein
MKTIFLWAGLGTLLLSTPVLRAQVNSIAAAEQREEKALSFLDTDDRNKYLDAKSKALVDNPDLKTDRDALITQRPARGASQDDRQAYMEKAKDYQEKLRDAMLKEDPTLQPIFDEIDKHMADLKEQRQKGAGGATPPASGNN